MADVEVLERGDIFFLYRPRVEEEQSEGLRDVQRFEVVLLPDGAERGRLLVVGRKRLPEVHDGGAREWGFIDRVAKPDALGEDLARKTYETRTRGVRTQPGARPAGEGRYAIVRHEAHTHLAYALELPWEPDEVQRELRIAPEASYVVSVKNPEASSPRGAGLDRARKAGYPQELQEKFEDRRFAPVDPPRFLDHEGAELVLVGADEDIEADLGLHLRTEDEKESTSELLRELRLERADHPRRPLLRGEWA